jgi:hypothetical protein
MSNHRFLIAAITLLLVVIVTSQNLVLRRGAGVCKGRGQVAVGVIVGDAGGMASPFPRHINNPKIVKIM